MPRSSRRGKKREPPAWKKAAGGKAPEGGKGGKGGKGAPRVAMGKGVDVGRDREEERRMLALSSTPSTVLNRILSVLDLTFERDIGMLNGNCVRKVPDYGTLVKLRDELQKLHHLFEHISQSDQASIDLVRQIREKRKQVRIKEEEEQEQQQKHKLKLKLKLKDVTKIDASATDDKPEPTEESAKAESPEAKEGPVEAEEDTLSRPKPDDVETVEIDTQVEETKAESGKDEVEPSEEKDAEVKDPEATDETKAEEQIDETEKPDTVLKRTHSEISSDVENVGELKVEDGQEEPGEGEAPPKKIKLNLTEETNDAQFGKPEENEGTEVSKDVDIDKMENDPTVKNPKSEFVVSQTLPLAAKALGLFNEEGLECTGEEFLKKKYSVASYPTTDLSDKLPGELPDMDFSCPKPTNQIQFNTFLASVEKFYREFSDNDIGFLEGKYILPQNLQVDSTYDPEVTPYIIPKLGQLYTEIWAKEDQEKNIGNTSPPSVTDPSSILPKKGAANINDTILETEDVSCGPLVSRLISAIMKESTQNIDSNMESGTPGHGLDEIKSEPDHGLPADDKDISKDNDNAYSVEGNSSLAANADSVMTNGDTVDNDDHNSWDVNPLSRSTTSTLPAGNGWKIENVNIDYPTFEERLKRELKYVGIYMNLPKDENNPNGEDPDWLNGREDDEVSAELRQLQATLKQVTKRNQLRKKNLIPLVERQLAWQEYSSILDDLNKQLDQAYIKRIRVPKKRRKHHGSATSGSASQLAQQKAANSSLKALLDKRQRWITKIGPLFDSPDLMLRIPKDSVFPNLDAQDDDDDDIDVFAQNNMNKEEGLED